MTTNDNFNFMTLAKYWPDLTAEERSALLTETRLMMQLRDVSLSHGSFKVIAEELSAAGITAEDDRFARLALLVSEKASERCPRCPCCGCALIVIPEEGTFCSGCEWFQGHEDLQGQLDDAWT